jgi:peptidoglycan/LPS O-acetylase OafA/YrhL
LTPLRGFAALIVAAGHFPGIAAAVAKSTQVLHHVYYSVDFFFVLSGFILLHVYGREFSSGVSKATAVRFLIARIARIYPLHVATLGALVALALGHWLVSNYVLVTPTREPLTQYVDVPAVWTNLLLVQGWGIVNRESWNYPSWSISTEWAAYMLFPWLAALAVTNRLSPLMLAAAAYGGIAALIVTHGGLDATLGPWALVRCVSEFCLGLAVYQIYVRAPDKTMFGHDAFAIAAVALVALMYHVRSPDILFPLAASALVLFCALNRTAVLKLLSTRPCQFLGDISYSIYMVHMPFFTLFFVLEKVTGKPIATLPAAVLTVVFLIYLSGTVVAAAVLYKTVEIPWRTRLRATLSRRMGAAEPTR